ncbi:MAG: sugar phosphate isomerase/epimerase family protein [Acidobacteriota bacterium]
MQQERKRINRRVFMGGGGRLLMGAGIIVGMARCGSREKGGEGEPSEAAKPQAEGSYGPFRMGFQSYSLRNFRSLAEFIPAARQLKLGYVELYRGHLDPSSLPEQIRAVREQLASAGLRVNAFGVEPFSANHENNEKLFQLGKALGVSNLSADPSRDAFDSLERLVRQYDIRIAIHNHGPEDERWRRPEWVLKAVQDRDPRIGSCADLGHFIRAGVDPVEAIEKLGSRVLGVHLKDFDPEGNDVVLGDGQLDLSQTLAALKKVGFDGPLSLEFEGDDPIPAMLECLARVRDAVRNL